MSFRETRLFGPSETPLTRQNASTGLLEGGVISINAGDNTKIDITAGQGLIIDVSDPTRVIYTPISWEAKTAVPITSIAAQDTTFIALDANGDVVEFAGFPANGDLRSHIALGAALHADRATISSVSQVTATRPFQIGVTLTEMGDALGVIKLRDPAGLLNLIVEGDPAGNLKIKRGAGKVFFPGIERNPEDPNTLITPEETAPVMLQVFRDGSGGFVVVSSDTITAGVFDDNSGGVSAPTDALSTNSWTNHRVYYTPDQDVTVLEYGQTKYNTSDDALAGLSQERPIFNPALTLVPIMAAITMRGGATDLTDIGDAIFTQATKLGEF